MRDEFVREMINTVKGFVYSAAKQKQLVATFKAEGRDEGSAWSELYQRTCRKFRHSHLKGQFSELLLCNLLQHYFRAAPLLRKMPITSNPNIERHGADAIHVGELAGRYAIYIGEAKTYHRKSNCFRDAVVDSLNGALDHYSGHRRELNLYTYEDFLTPELETLARQYQRGDMIDAEVHLVCIASYNCTRSISGSCRQELLDGIIANTLTDVGTIAANPAFAAIPSNLVPRLHFILFSVRDLNSLIAAFTGAFGNAT